MGLFDRLQSEVEGRERQAQLSPLDLLDLPDEARRVVQLLARRGELADEAVADSLGLTSADLASVLDDLVARGFILRRDIHGLAHSRTYFGRRRGRELPINLWDALADRTRAEDPPAPPDEAGA